MFSSIDHDKIMPTRKKEVLQNLNSSQSSINPKLEFKARDLQSRFLHALEVVTETFQSDPHSLQRLKGFFSRLSLPWKTPLPIVDAGTYENAAGSEELFAAQPGLWNCFSPHLLVMISKECGRPEAIDAMKQFTVFRSKFASSLFFEQIYTLPEERKKATFTQSSLLMYHTCPLSELQSLHPSVFECLDEQKSSESQATIRLTVQVDQLHLTLQDYDDITTAVCGYFHIPRVALVYAGCSEDGQVICWTTSASLLPYLRGVSPSRCSDRLMAEQSILRVAAGDLYYQCLSLKVWVLPF